MQLLRTHLVTLPADRRPELPTECVACGAPDPDAAITVADRAFTWSSVVVAWAYWSGRKEKRSFPACTGCRRTDRLVAIGRVMLFVGLVVGALTVVRPWVQSFELGRASSRLLTLALCAVAIAPALLWPMLFPRAVTLDVSKQTVDYQFARKEYAALFLALDRGH